MKAICRTALVVGALIAPCVAVSQAAPPLPARIVTRGTARVELPPDHASINISVQAVAPLARDAATEHSALITQVTRALEEIGVPSDSVDVVGYAVVPNYEYTSDGREQHGYLARAGVRFRVWDVAALGPVVEAALGAGARSVDGMQFLASNTEAARDSALGLAVQNARHDAEILAAAAGETLGALLELTMEGGTRPIGSQIVPQRERVLRSAGVTIAPLDVVVEVAVVGQWLISNR